MRKHSISAAAVAALLLTPAVPAAPAFAQTGNPLNSIFRCDAAGNKQSGGAAVGAVLGGLLGNQTSSKRSRGLSTVLGAAVGAAAGSYIGCRMQTSDQQRAEAAARRALDSGESTTWTNPETGASGRFDVVRDDYDYGRDGRDRRDNRDRRDDRAVSLSGVRFAPGVEPFSSYVGAAGRYRANSRVNLRAAPSANARVIAQMEPGESVEALARVRAYPNDWILAGHQGVAVGYVSEQVVERVRRNYAGGRDDACRSFDQTVTTRGETQTTRYTACKDRNGEWVVQA